MQKPNRTAWMLTLVCIFLGFSAVLAYDKPRAQLEIGGVASLQNIEKLVNEKRELDQKKQELDQFINEQENQIKNYENNAAQTSIQLQWLQKDLQEARLTAGLVSVQGPGIEIILNDRKRDSILSANPYMIKYFIVHDSDMLHIINELRDAGAEAIAVNGTRIMANSRISCGGPTIHVGKYERFAPPFVIQAIGNPDTLFASFQEEDSISQDLIAWGLEFHIRKMDRVEIPRYMGETEHVYAKLIQGDD